MGKIADLLQERGQLDQALRIRAQGRNGVTPGGSRSNMARGRRLASSAAKRSGSQLVLPFRGSCGERVGRHRQAGVTPSCLEDSGPETG